MDEKKMKCMDQDSQAVSVHFPRIMIAGRKERRGEDVIYLCASFSFERENSGGSRV